MKRLLRWRKQLQRWRLPIVSLMAKSTRTQSSPQKGFPIHGISNSIEYSSYRTLCSSRPSDRRSWRAGNGRSLSSPCSSYISWLQVCFGRQRSVQYQAPSSHCSRAPELQLPLPARSPLSEITGVNANNAHGLVNTPTASCIARQFYLVQFPNLFNNPQCEFHLASSKMCLASDHWQNADIPLNSWWQREHLDTHENQHQRWLGMKQLRLT